MHLLILAHQIIVLLAQLRNLACFDLDVLGLLLDDWSDKFPGSLTNEILMNVLDDHISVFSSKFLANRRHFRRLNTFNRLHLSVLLICLNLLHLNKLLLLSQRDEDPLDLVFEGIILLWLLLMLVVLLFVLLDGAASQIEQLSLVNKVGLVWYFDRPL